MNRFFLHTTATFNSSGVAARTHVDCDSIPVVKIYSKQNNELIETPIVTKSTIEFANGHYLYPLNWRFYTRGSHYYDIVTFVFNSNTMVTDKRFFTWGMTDDTTGDSDKGFNYNLDKALLNLLRENTDIVALLGHVDTVAGTRIVRERIRRKGSVGYPCLTWKVGSGQTPPTNQSNVSTIRNTFLEFRFWDNEDEEMLIELNDKLMVYLVESDNFQGLKVQTSDLVFYTYNLEYDQTLESPDGDIVWFDESRDLYSCGCRVILRAASF